MVLFFQQQNAQAPDDAQEKASVALMKQETAQLWQSQIKFLKEAMATQQQYMQYLQNELAATEGRRQDTNGTPKTR